MKFNVKGNSGFSLIELMVVVGIIGILATLALPKLNVFMAKARQGEVKTNLGTIYTLQEVFKAESATGVYGASISAIGFTAPTGAKYTYTTTATAGTAFNGNGTAAAGALCTGSPAETWTINQTKAFTLPTAVTCN